MYCPKCGTLNDNNARQCIQCFHVLTGQAHSHIESRVISNHLAMAILCTIVFCWPFGIPAIVFAAKVNGKIAAGDVQGAIEASRKAKMWCWIAFFTWFTFALISGLFALFGSLHLPLFKR